MDCDSCQDFSFGSLATLEGNVITYCAPRYKSWKRRWFILNDNCLYYFEFTTDKEPRGIIPLENISVSNIWIFQSIYGVNEFWTSFLADKGCDRQKQATLLWTVLLWKWSDQGLQDGQRWQGDYYGLFRYFILVRSTEASHSHLFTCFFQLSPSHCQVVEGKHTVYRMSASTEEEKDDWIKCIQWVAVARLVNLLPCWLFFLVFPLTLLFFAWRVGWPDALVSDQVIARCFIEID